MNMEKINFRSNAGTNDRVKSVVERRANPLIRTPSEWYRHVVLMALRRDEDRIDREERQRRVERQKEARRQRRRAGRRTR